MANEFVTVVSAAQPLDDQEHRSSVNFTTEDMQQKSPSKDMIMLCIYAYYDYGEATQTVAEGVTFDIKVDKSGSDPTFVSGVGHGIFVQNTSHRNLYIANPVGAEKEFTVVIENKVGVNSLSEPDHQHGQKYRSSNNFALSQFKSGKFTIDAYYDYQTNEPVKATGIIFDINKDINHGEDEFLGRFTTGMEGDNEKVLKDSIYIADPKNAKREFAIVFTELSK